MKRIVFSVFFVFVAASFLQAQHEFDKWIFGNGVGLDFTGGAPAVISSTIDGWDNCASISDSSGGLLFFSEGMHVYDRNGNLMPNGNGLLGDTSGGQAATIVRKPGSLNLYYLFTNTNFAGPKGFRYSIVDMSLNGGLGDVDTTHKNVLVLSPNTEKVCPIVHGNGYDVWILIHEWNTNIFRAYLLTSNGLSPNYVPSIIGSIHGSGGNTNSAIGELSATRSGDRVACPIFQGGKIEVFNFNNMSGVLSNAISISGYNNTIGMEFSPDGSKLYATDLNDSHLTQFDLSVYNDSAITASAKVVGTINATWANYTGGYMTLGPDDKIYVAQTFSNKIGRIDFPNAQGLACHYDSIAINLGPKTLDAGIVDKIAATPVNYTIQIDLGASQTICNGSNLILNPYVHGAIPPYTYSWGSIGDTLSCGTCKNPSVTVTQNSTYILTVTDVNNKTAVDTVSYTVSGINNPLTMNLVVPNNIDCNHIADTTYAFVNNGTEPIDFYWGDGTSQLGSSPQVHTYTQVGIYVISVTDSQSCITSAFDTVINTGIAVNLVQAIQPICLGDTTGSIFVNVTGGVHPYSFHWSNGSALDSLVTVPGGSYSLSVSDVNSCTTVFNYNLNPANDIGGFYVYMYPTNANCINNGAIMAGVYSGVPPYSYLWNTGDTVANLMSLGAGVYNITVTDSAGCRRKGFTEISMSCQSIISGYVFVDANNNCIPDSNDVAEAFTWVAASSNGKDYFGFTDWSGMYSITVPDTGTYFMATSGYDGYCANFSLCGSSNQTITISGLGDSSFNNNFAASINPGFDLTTHPGWTAADPGFPKEYWVMPFNQSSVPFTGAFSLTFTYDSNLVYQYSLPPIPVHDPVNHTLTWSMDTTLPFPSWDWYGYRYETFFQVPVDLSLGYLLQSDFYITPTEGDCDSSNNRLHFSETVIGSHDPNAKTVQPADNIFVNDSVLTYTIYFQNTGTDSTWFIVIKDTLSDNLDPKSVKNIASSHPYTDFKISGNGILTWTFNPLRLVDSITNPHGSEGFITFTVKKKATIPVGSIISNTAYVYFDYYDAVITNTVSDTVRRNVTSISNNEIENGISVKAYPNPFNDLTHVVVNGINVKYDFELFDVTGRLMNRVPSVTSNQFELHRDGLSSGVYFYRILIGSKPSAFGKLVIQ